MESLEVVTVCINYSDFLRYTLPNNKRYFDNYVVVTTQDDIKTIEVCRDNNVKCVQINKSSPTELDNKGIAINAGLKELKKDGWVLNLDADMWLPPLTRTMLNKLPLQTDCIYGTDRFMCESFEEFKKFLEDEDYKRMHSDWVYVETSRFKIGKRMAHYYREGYWPIGFFQLWHPEGSGICDYPAETLHGYDRDDVFHMKRWPMGKRVLIPDFIPIHLSSQPHDKGQNWKGRSTIEFGDGAFEFDFSKVINVTEGAEKRNQY